MSRLGSVFDRRIKPVNNVDYVVYEKDVIPDHLKNYIWMNKMMMEQHDYLMSFFPKPKDGCIMKFIKKIFS